MTSFSQSLQTNLRITIDSTSGSTLRRWINEYDQYGESAFPGYTLPRIVRTAQKTPPCRGILSFKRSGAA